jgi:hypothetical protein
MILIRDRYLRLVMMKIFFPLRSMSVICIANETFVSIKFFQIVAHLFFGSFFGKSNK